jgi:TPR repeat protein
MKGKTVYKKAIQIHAKMYNQSISGSKKISYYTEYLALLRSAAYKGHREAQYDLGQQYEDMNYLNLNNPKYNPKKCIYWYTKSCMQNYAAACNNLAYLYETGAGCRKNLKLALQLYKKAADLGYEIAKDNYRIMLKQIMTK